jgi:hypothetical protein
VRGRCSQRRLFVGAFQNCLINVALCPVLISYNVAKWRIHRQSSKSRRNTCRYWRSQDYIIVPHEGVAHCTFDADIADTSRKYERSDAVRAENSIQIGVMECIEPMLGDNYVMFSRADVSVEFGTQVPVPQTGYSV